jgi:hypothetical protein
MKMPAKLGAKIDLAYNLRAERLAVQKEYDEKIEKMKAQETEVKEAIIAELRQQKMDKGSGEKCTASIMQNIIPQVTDWDRVYGWVKKTGAFEIFERRVSKSAFKERYEAGEGIPGIDAREIEDLSLTKR